ncbi:unnamed protein product [Rotaria sp. Silwood1]|nr:unnamed protein product [Rotaria sp. Silwood1]
MIYIILFLCIVSIESSHFYGGTVTWRPMSNTDTSSKVAIMFTQSYQWRRSYGASTYCDQTVITNQSPKLSSGTNTLQCRTTPSSACGSYSSIDIGEYCTDFSTIVDSSSGQISTIQNITAGSVFCVSFQGSAWIGLQSSNCGGTGRKKRFFLSGSGTTTKRTTVSTTTGASCYSTSAAWSIGCCLDLTVRSDGFINTPPVATVLSPIQVSIDTLTNITIPVIDADNDYTSCRWAQKTTTFDECGDVCQTAPGSILYDEDCVVTFNSTGKSVGEYYAITLMVEDFYDQSTYTPFSSVPIQFLIHIVNTSTCSLKPTINSTLSGCTAVEVGQTFNFTLTIIQGCTGTTILDFFRTPPLYMIKSSVVQVGTTNTWEVTETWTPVTLQIGSQVYCAVATDSLDIQSDQYCLTFRVVSAGSPLSCVTNTSSTNAAASNTSAETGSNTKNDAWIIALSVLGFLSLLGLCCCCWWWLFAKGRRHRTAKEKDHILKYSSMNEQKTDPLESSFGTQRQLVSVKNQPNPKKTISRKSRTIEPLNSKNGISTSSEPITNSALINAPYSSSIFDIAKNKSFQQQPNIQSMSFTSATGISLIDKPLANEENKNIKPPNTNDDTELRKISTKKNSSSKMMKLSKRNSIGPRDHSIDASKLAGSFQSNTQIAGDLLSKPRPSGSVSVSKVNRSSLPNKESFLQITNDSLLPTKKRQTVEMNMIKIPQSNVTSHMPNEGNVKAAKLSKSINVQENLLHTSNHQQHDNVNISSDGVKNISVSVKNLPRVKLSTNT